MVLNKLKQIIGEIKKDIEKIIDIIPEDKQKVIRDLVVKAAIAYGEAKIREKINE